jgi:hypothetical protein
MVLLSHSAAPAADTEDKTMASTTHTPLPERIDFATEPSGPRKARGRIATRSALTWPPSWPPSRLRSPRRRGPHGRRRRQSSAGAHSELAPNHHPDGFDYSSVEDTGGWKDSLLGTKAGDPAYTATGRALNAEADRYVEWLESGGQQAATTPTASDAERAQSLLADAATGDHTRLAASRGLVSCPPAMPAATVLIRSAVTMRRPSLVRDASSPPFAPRGLARYGASPARTCAAS